MKRLNLLVLSMFCLPALAQQDARVVVMTSYPQEMIARYETAFEAANPAIDLVFEWRRSNDAWQLLQTPAGAAVDVYWAPSLDTFVAMADADKFAELQPREGLPGRIGALQIDDAKHRFAAFEVAGFGFALNEATLNSKGLPIPHDWSDLTDARYAGTVLMPVPSRQGFSPMIFASMLQGFGWQHGWSTIDAIAANSELMGNGGGAFIDDIAEGKHGVALTIDFFPKGAQANGLPVQFRYADTTLFSPAYVALMKARPHQHEADVFMDYVMSDAGQALLLHRDVARLPVRPTAYPADAEYNPFAMGKKAPAFDFLQAGPQQVLLAALFDVQVTNRHDELVAAMTTLRDARQVAAGNKTALAKVEQAEALLLAPAIDEKEATTILGSLATVGNSVPADFLPVQAWTQTLSSRMEKALALAEEAVLTVTK